jgi:hypothetical protein
MTKDGDTEDVEEEKCSDFLKPNSEEYCNVHNPCPGEGMVWKVTLKKLQHAARSIGGENHGRSQTGK